MDRGTDIPPAPSLPVSVRDGCTVATPSGELDLTGAPALREQLIGLLGPHNNRLVVDLSKVTFCDASGLAVLVGVGRRARLLGGFLHLAALTPAVAAVLRITGLDRRLDIFPTVAAATTSAGEPARPGQRPI